MRLEPGDIFLTRGNSFISRAIRFFSRSGGESRTMVNHVGLVTEPGTMYDATIVEASSKVIRRKMSAYALSKNTEIAVYRNKNLTEDQRQAICQRADGYVGASYGYLKIVAHFLDWLLGGRYFFRRFAFMDRYPICSWVVAYSYLDAGLTFGVEPGSATPDDIWDWVYEHPEDYLEVRPIMKPRAPQWG